MEELHCLLLGLDSLEHLVNTTKGNNTFSKFAIATENSKTSFIHPSEVSFIRSALPLGQHYSTLKDFVLDVRIGRNKSLYGSAISSGLHPILQEYEKMVKKVVSPLDLTDIVLTYEKVFSALSALIVTTTTSSSSLKNKNYNKDKKSTLETNSLSQQHQSNAISLLSKQLRGIHEFINSPAIDKKFRICLGQAVVMKFLFMSAHWVAHGVILGGGKNSNSPMFDFCIQQRQKKTTPQGNEESKDGVFLDASASSKKVSMGGATDGCEFVIHRDLLPCGVSEDVAIVLLQAGYERYRLLEELEEKKVLVGDKKGGNNLLGANRRASMNQKEQGVRSQTEGDEAQKQGPKSTIDNGDDVDDDQVAFRLFDSIYSSELCLHEELQQDALLSRLLEAKEEWSSQLWQCVGQSTQLDVQLSAFLDMTLCQRGDLWGTFVDTAFPSICNIEHFVPNAAVSFKGGSGGLLTPTQVKNVLTRAVHESFSSSLHSVGLADCEALQPFQLHFGASSGVLTGSSDNGGGGFLSSVPPRSPEEAAVLCLRRIDQIHLQYIAPHGMYLILDSSDFIAYQSIFKHHLRLKFSLCALKYCQRFIRELSRHTRMNHTLSSLSLLLHNLNFLLTNYAYFLQVDIQQPQYTILHNGMKTGLTSIQQVQKLQKGVVEKLNDVSLAGGKEETEEVAVAIYQAFRCSFALYLICSRPDAFQLIQHDMPSTDFGISLSHLKNCLFLEIFPALRNHLSVATKVEHRALWTRLDFNKWLSTGGQGGGKKVPVVGGFVDSSSRSVGGGGGDLKRKQQQSQQFGSTSNTMNFNAGSNITSSTAPNFSSVPSASTISSGGVTRQVYAPSITAQAFGMGGSASTGLQATSIPSRKPPTTTSSGTSNLSSLKGYSDTLEE